MAGAGAAPLSPPLQPRGLGGTRARRRGSRALPAAPASIAAPRALIGLGAATTRGGVPCGASPPPPRARREPGKGRREVAPPRAAQPPDRAWRPATATPPAPGRPRGRRFHPTARAGWGLSGWGRGRGPEGKKAAASLSARSRGSRLLAEGCGARHCSSPPRRPAQSRPSGDRGSPLAPGYFPHHQVSA